MRTSFCILLLLLSVSFYASGQTNKTTKTTTKPVAAKSKTTKTATTKPKSKSTKPTTTKTPAKPEGGILFVKIKSYVFKTMVGAFDIRARIEDKIEEQLEITRNGEWISGDTGPGEANILFNVKNIEPAIKSILKVLSEENFDKSVIIGLRTSSTASENHWSYKVIYPKDYKGTL